MTSIVIENGEVSALHRRAGETFERNAEVAPQGRWIAEAIK